MNEEIIIGNIEIDNEINLEDLTLDVQKVYPELEDLEIIPSGFEQKFKSKKYGYNNILVKAVSSDILNVEPSNKKQKFEGLFNTVNVEAIKIPNEKWYEEETEIWT